MKYKFMILAETKEERDKLIEFLDKNKAEYITPNLDQSQLPGKSCCEDCNKEVEQKVVNYCKIQFDGHIYCRDCQKKLKEAP